MPNFINHMYHVCCSICYVVDRGGGGGDGRDGGVLELPISSMLDMPID